MAGGGRWVFASTNMFFFQMFPLKFRELCAWFADGWNPRNDNWRSCGATSTRTGCAERGDVLPLHPDFRETIPQKMNLVLACLIGWYRDLYYPLDWEFWSSIKGFSIGNQYQPTSTCRIGWDRGIFSGSIVGVGTSVTGIDLTHSHSAVLQHELAWGTQSPPKGIVDYHRLAFPVRNPEAKSRI